MAKHVALPVSRTADPDLSLEHADGPHTSDEIHVRFCLVDDDGTVRAWDAVSETYSVHHDLSSAQQDEARRLAGA